MQRRVKLKIYETWITMVNIWWGKKTEDLFSLNFGQMRLTSDEFYNNIVHLKQTEKFVIRSVKVKIPIINFKRQESGNTICTKY